MLDYSRKLTGGDFEKFAKSIEADEVLFKVNPEAEEEFFTLVIRIKGVEYDYKVNDFGLELKSDGKDAQLRRKWLSLLVDRFEKEGYKEAYWKYVRGAK